MLNPYIPLTNKFFQNFLVDKIRKHFMDILLRRFKYIPKKGRKQKKEKY